MVRNRKKVQVKVKGEERSVCVRSQTSKESRERPKEKKEKKAQRRGETGFNAVKVFSGDTPSPPWKSRV